MKRIAFVLAALLLLFAASAHALIIKQRTWSPHALDNTLRRELKVGDPSNATAVAKALTQRYSTGANITDIRPTFVKKPVPIGRSIPTGNTVKNSGKSSTSGTSWSAYCGTSGL